MEFKDAIEGGFVIDIYNYIGVKVISEKVSQLEAEHILDLTPISNGIYLYTVTTTNNIYKGKFAVLK